MRNPTIQRRARELRNAATDAERQGYDRLFDTAIGAQGFRVLRFWNNQVLGETDAVVGVILRALGERLPPS